jgi:hypothetical protein
MGLFDSYFDPQTYSSGGGLIDRLMAQLQTQGQYQPSQGLPPNPMDANAQAPNAPIAVGDYQMPRIGGAFPQDVSPPQIDPQHMQAPEAAPMQQPATQPSFLQPQNSPGGFGGAFRGAMANMSNGPIGMLMGGAAGAMGMGRGTPEEQQRRALQLRYQGLLDAGVPEVKARLAVIDPEYGKTIVTQALGPQTLTPLGEGYVADKSGHVTRAYEPGDKNKLVKIGQDGLGREQYGVFNPSDGSIAPYKGPGAGSDTGGGIGNMDLTGKDYLASVPKAQAGIMQGMVDGTIQPPSSFALSKPYWQNMLAGAKNLDPNFDANNWTSRHKMSNDIAASGNSSMGGILSNGKSSFKHLAEYTESASDLGNASHDYLGGGAVASAQNYIGNRVLAGSDTRGKIKAINDNLGKYGAESTKFYSGTGGGVEERTAALKEMDPTTTSSAEMAAFANKEKSLMLDRLREKEAHMRDVMGDAYLQKHPVFTDELKADIARIETNVAKLRGGQPSATAPGQTKTGVSWSVVQ